MARAFLVVMDSVGIGGAPDAARFASGGVPDTGANTVGHIAEWCARERPEGVLRLPVLDGLGLGAAVKLASGLEAPGLGRTPTGLWGAATEKGPGKDTPSGHWELAGRAVPFEWTVFPDTQPCFPDDIIAALCEAAAGDVREGHGHARLRLDRGGDLAQHGHVTQRVPAAAAWSPARHHQA